DLAEIAKEFRDSGELPQVLGKDDVLKELGSGEGQGEYRMARELQLRRRELQELENLARMENLHREQRQKESAVDPLVVGDIAERVSKGLKSGAEKKSALKPTR